MAEFEFGESGADDGDWLDDAIFSISVVIPTLNEAQNLPWVLSKVPRFVDEVVLVDGRSTDGTVDVARQHYPEIVVVDEQRHGKGAALRAGFAAATGDVVIIIDADGSMDPNEIQRFVALVRAGFDVVKGSRFMAGGGSSDITRFRRLGNQALLRLVNGLYGAQFTDLCYGFIAMRRDCIPKLGLASDGFEIETEITVRAARAGLNVCEVPSFESPRRSGTSNLRSVRDGCRVLRTLLVKRFGDKPVLDLTDRIDLTDEVVQVDDDAVVIDLRAAVEAKGLRSSG
ncbi:MAG TPA: glycosyltransferase family 2 protein [Acidimicrobiales bacterium]|jgi:glycosyltransferase involved in cell wall biosynthesis|nr:glycosyltransferase family 2 protein [Acidimicrobiales bacterium]